MTRETKILLTRRWPGAVEDYLGARFAVTCNETDTPMSAGALHETFDHYDIVCPTVSDRIDVAIIGAKPRRTKLLASFGVGFDHIDTAACRIAGIRVTNTPGVLTDATADLAMTLMLAAARRAGEGERELRAGKWTGWRPTHMLGRSLSGKSLGLVGFGRIAQATARRAHAGFGMNIVYYSRRAAPEEIVRELNAHRADSLHALLAQSDFVSLHVPGGDETTGMIGARELAHMKNGAILVNTARGGVIDHDALTEALSNGKLGGAGLDVYPHEPEVPAALLSLENIVLLPHLGSATQETREAMGMRVAANVEAFVSGEALPDPLV
jgi:lactate dehydrogenase-like 2-hydroxyacid dehydrogenase